MFKVYVLIAQIFTGFSQETVIISQEFPTKSQCMEAMEKVIKAVPDNIVYAIKCQVSRVEFNV